MVRTFNLDNLKITYLGQAGFKIQSSDLTIYLDPYNLRAGESADVSAESAKSAEKADLILVTHDHFDHQDEKSIKLISKPSTEILIGNESIQEGEEKEIKGVKIIAVPAYNLTKPFHPRGKGCGFILEIDGKRIYHAGDTDKIPEMAKLGKIDLAMLPIGGTYTMDIQEAAEAVEIIKSKVAIPMHYNTLPEITADPEKFKELVGSTSEVIIL